MRMIKSKKNTTEGQATADFSNSGIEKALIMDRLPKKQEVFSVLLTTLSVVNIWALIVFLYTFPGLINQLTLLEVLVVLSYVLFSAFFESVVITVVLVILGIVLPAALLRTEFPVRSALFVLLSVIYIIPFHIYLPRISILMFEAPVLLFLAFWTMLYLVELVLFHLVVERYPNFVSGAKAALERVSVLGAIYLLLDGIAVIYIAVANWS